MFFQEQFCIFTSLTDLISVIGIPSATLIDNIFCNGQIQNISFSGNALSVNNINLSSTEWWCHFIFHNFDLGSITDRLTILFDLLPTSDFQTNGGIIFQCTATGRCLRITEHDTNFLTQLVDKDHRTIGLADDRCQFTQCLRH